jgi:hypothetical protein
MVKDPFEDVAEDIDSTVDEKEEIEAKKERRETAKYYYCDVVRVFNSQKELRDFYNSGGENIPDNMVIIKGSMVNPVKKVVYTF